MRYDSKQALMVGIQAEHDLLISLLEGISKGRWNETGVWGDDWTLGDLVAHLGEWQFMFLGWYEDGLHGAIPEMPAPGFKWNETQRLNQAIWAKHRARSRGEVRADFDLGYTRILRIVETLSPQQLLESGHFAWTGKHSLSTYIGPNTASHYRFAIKAIKRWLKRSPTSGKSASRSKQHAQPAKARTKAVRKDATGSRRRDGRAG